ncbi:MAG: hypothetical protein IJC43_00160, partial [Clostridia bacterium]|nr:hypothetical protein [Clostridia bacterium]
QNGLWGVASLRGELLWEPRYSAIFAVPFGEQPGWYGLRDDSYERLATLDAGQRPVLDTAAQLALSGAELILLSRDATGHLTADTATGTAYLLPPAVGETLFETAPLYTLRRVTERREALAVADVPLPPYVLCPVTEIGIDEERAVRTYPEQLLSRLVGGEGPLALEEFTILDLDISETGDVYHRLALTLEVTPRRRPGSDSGTLWGEPEEDGRCRLTLGMTLYRAEQEGRRWLCAAAPDGVPFEGLPEPAAWEPPVWRYQARQLQNRYEQMMAGEAEERVFYENESITLLEERRLEPDEEGRAYRYRVTVARLDGEERESLFDMPYAMGDITVRAVTDQGLLVITWRSLYASSGFEGSFGLLTAEGFAPMLEKATCLGEGPDAIYLIGQRNDVRGIYVMNTVTGLLRLLCPLPGAPFSPQLHSARLLLADPARLLLAWPTGGDEAYEIFSVTLPRGETTRLWPQP